MATFLELKAWLDGMPNQRKGLAGPLSETGETYIEFFAKGLARPGDEAIIEAEVVEQIWAALSRYFYNKSGPIHVRTPLEWETKPHSVVVRLDENGPDVDFITNQKCVMDHNWRRVACYCRLVRAVEQTAEAA